MSFEVDSIFFVYWIVMLNKGELCTINIMLQ